MVIGLSLVVGCFVVVVVVAIVVFAVVVAVDFVGMIVGSLEVFAVALKRLDVIVGLITKDDDFIALVLERLCDADFTKVLLSWLNCDDKSLMLAVAKLTVEALFVKLYRVEFTFADGTVSDACKNLLMAEYGLDMLKTDRFTLSMCLVTELKDLAPVVDCIPGI